MRVKDEGGRERRTRGEKEEKVERRESEERNTKL